MKTQIILLFNIIALCMFSCSNEKEYKYIEIVKQIQLTGNGRDIKEKEEKIIMAANDSIAYLEAYKIFCISITVNKQMKADYGLSPSLPKSFKLINEEGINVVNTMSISIKKEIEEEVENLWIKDTLK